MLPDTNLWINLCDTGTLWNTIQLKIIIDIYQCPYNWFMDIKPPHLVSYLAYQFQWIRYCFIVFQEQHIRDTNSLAYPNIYIWVDLDAICVLIPHCDSHLKHRIMHISCLLWCQQDWHQGKRKLIVQLQIAQYKLKPFEKEHNVNFPGPYASSKSNLLK